MGTPAKDVEEYEKKPGTDEEVKLPEPEPEKSIEERAELVAQEKAKKVDQSATAGQTGEVK